MAKVQAEGEVITYSFLDKNQNEITREKKNLNLVIAQESEKAMLAILVQLGLTVLQRDKSKPTAGAKRTADPPQPGTVGYQLAQMFKEKKNDSTI
jgi:hypothetical protein